MRNKFQRVLNGRLLTLALMAGLIAFLAPVAHSQTFSVFHNFTGGTDGGYPLSGLVIDALGNLYGTSSAGGKYGSGAVFKFKTTGEETVLYSFTDNKDGGTPEAALLLHDGVLYGTTNTGGAYGAGTVFELTLAGKETVLYSFTGKADGANPQASLVRDTAGNLYGTTFAGGKYGNGAVFKLVAPTVAGGAWIERVLHSFGSAPDGAQPVAGVTLGVAGQLYGTTSAGGTYGYGTVFALTSTTTGWKENILHHFAMQADGGVPYAGIVLHAGNLYGAATDGGGGGTNGGGTVFEFTPSNGHWVFHVISSLAGWGISGTFRNFIFSSNSIYATTHCDGAYTAGTVYELSPSGSAWTYKSLYVFTGGTDGLFSFSNLVLDAQGNLYGTTHSGGANGFGVVFKITP